MKPFLKRKLFVISIIITFILHVSDVQCISSSELECIANNEGGPTKSFPIKGCPWYNSLKKIFSEKEVCDEADIILKGKVLWVNDINAKKQWYMTSSIKKTYAESYSKTFHVNSYLSLKLNGISQWIEMKFAYPFLDAYCTHKWTDDITKDNTIRSHSPMTSSTYTFSHLKNTKQVTITCESTLNTNVKINPSILGNSLGELDFKSEMFLGYTYNTFWIEIIKPTKTASPKDPDPKISEVPEKFN